MSDLGFASDVAFTPAVKAVQSALGSRGSYARVEEKGGWETKVTSDLATFLAETRSAFLATASAEGQPYIQHRGGPKGFIQVLDDQTLAFADYAGNRQYISIGNLTENSKAQLFLIDFMHRRRIKIWGRARFVDDDPQLLERLAPEGYRARPERVLIFNVSAWDVNCPQHIPQRFDAEDVANVLAQRDQRIAELESRLANLESHATGLSGEVS